MRQLTLKIFHRRLGWYWRLQSGNNRIIAVGAEPFASARNARRAFERGVFGVPYSVEVQRR